MFIQWCWCWKAQYFNNNKIKCLLSFKTCLMLFLFCQLFPHPNLLLFTFFFVSSLKCSYNSWVVCFSSHSMKPLWMYTHNKMCFLWGGGWGVLDEIVNLWFVTVLVWIRTCICRIRWEYRGGVLEALPASLKCIIDFCKTATWKKKKKITPMQAFSLLLTLIFSSWPHIRLPVCLV